jgi:hypothetical protein
MALQTNTAYTTNTTDGNNRIIQELRAINRNTQVSGGGGGDASAANQLVEIDLLELQVWDKIIGNSKEFTWVAGTVSPFVVDTILYKTGVSTIFTQTFTYDANDNVLSITCS